MVLAATASAQVKAAIKREQNQTRLGSAEREQARTEFKVTGRVIDLQNKPVSDVIVKLVSGSKTLAFTSTNAKGEYALELKNAPMGEVSLQFNHISYEKESERLSPKERTTKLDMVLTPKAVSLKEVTVKPDTLRQRGDTLSHNRRSQGRFF